LVEKFRDLNLISRNFLQLNVVFDRLLPYVMADKQLMTSDNLLAQLGGVLGLWLGINFMTILEFFEFLYTVIRQRRNSTKTLVTSSSSPETLDMSTSAGLPKVSAK
jgi:hypothetical protein